MLREKGELDAAAAAMGDAVAVVTETLGAENMHTLMIEAQAAHLSLKRTGDAGSLKEVVAKMEAALGAQHQYTRKYAKVVEAL